MKINYQDELLKESAKHKDLALHCIDAELILRLRILIERLNTMENDIWDWPWNQSAKDNAEEFKDRFKHFENFILSIVRYNHKMNAHVVAGMMELTERILETSLKFTRDKYKEKFLKLRDEASTIYVCVKMFELDRIVGY